MLSARDNQRGKWGRRCVQKGGFRLSPKNWPVYYQPSWVLSAQIRKHRSLRLEAQDIALSRQVHEFESRRERHIKQSLTPYPPIPVCKREASEAVCLFQLRRFVRASSCSCRLIAITALSPCAMPVST